MKQLVKETADAATPCDGCGRSIPAGEPYIGEIESCCGGCYRHLCRECVLRAAALLEEKTMSDEPRNEDERVNREIESSHEEVGRCDLGQVDDVEMTLAQWVETLPPGHGARRELIALNGKAEELIAVHEEWACAMAQLARLPHSDPLAAASTARVDGVLRRVLDTESALASLVHLARQCEPRRLNNPEGLDAAVETAEKLLERRPRGMGGTAHGVSR